MPEHETNSMDDRDKSLATQAEASPARAGENGATPRFEIFSAGCPLCQEAIAAVHRIAPRGAEVDVIDMHQPLGAERARQYGISQVPAVIVDGKPSSL